MSIRRNAPPQRSASGEPIILIVEPNADGHRFYYVLLLLRDAVERGLRTAVLTTEGAARSREFAVHLASFIDDNDVELLTWRPRAGGTGSLRERVSAVKEILRDRSVDRIVVPDADQFLLQWAVQTPWGRFGRQQKPYVSLLLMRPIIGWSNARGLRARAVSVLKMSAIFWALKSRSVDQISLLQGSGQAGDSHLPSVVRQRTRPVTDPESMLVKATTAEMQREVRESLGLPVERTVFLIAGRLTSRKGVDLAILAWNALKHELKEAPLLVVAGEPDSEMALYFKTEPVETLLTDATLVLRLGYLDNVTFDAYIAAADCLLILQSNDGSSGILGKARASGTPALVACDGYAAADARTFGGAIVVDRDYRSLCGGLSEAQSRLDELRNAAQIARGQSDGSESRFANVLLGM